jgi:hypothetical protein
MPPVESTLSEQQLGRSEEIQLLRSFSRYIKLRKVGFPSADARHMAGLQDEGVFSRAGQVYRQYQ